MSLKYANPETGKLTPYQTFGFRFVSISANYTVTDYNFIKANASGGAITVTLPNPSKIVGVPICVIKIDNSGNAVTVSGTIAGGNISLGSQYACALVVSDGNTFYKIN